MRNMCYILKNKTDFFKQLSDNHRHTMSASTIETLRLLEAEWMVLYREQVRIGEDFYNRQVAIQEALQTIDNLVNATWDLFTEQERIEAELGNACDEERDIPSPKESSRSARSHARLPLVGNKSRGGKPRIVIENSNKRSKTVISHGGDAHTRPDRQSQEDGGVVRNIYGDFHYRFPAIEVSSGVSSQQNVYTSFAFKKSKSKKNKSKKNKSRRDQIFVE